MKFSILFEMSLALASVAGVAFTAEASPPPVTGARPTQEAPERAVLPPRRSAAPREPISGEVRDHRRDHRVDEAQALQQVAAFKEWMIGANRTGQIDLALNPHAPRGSRYSLKGLENRKFLFKKPRTAGKVKWTSDASAQTARDVSQWVLYPESRGVEDLDSGSSIRRQPLRYGERIALVWQPFTGSGAAPDDVFEIVVLRTGLHAFERQSTNELKYDWAILGGKKGTAVMMGSDKVVLFNVTRGQPLIFYPYTDGDRLQVGWPDTKADAKPALDVGKHEQLDEAVWEALLL
ncbi:MAG: hypothetical protein M3R16_03505 [Pseudomonadota bacterium]|nr:hypothetical protein [Pseudomonadota bacterium]